MSFLQPSDLDAILLSFKVACTATLLSTPLGIGVAYLLVHTRIPGKAIIEGIVNLPLVLPPVVIGYLLLVLFGRHGWIGAWLLRFDIQIIFTLTGAIIASSVVGFPLLVRSIRLGMESVDASYCQGGPNPGGRRLGRLFHHYPAAFRPGRSLPA